MDFRLRRIFKKTVTGLLFVYSFTVKGQSDSNAGLTLPEKFKAEMLIDGLGRARHIAVTPNNNLSKIAACKIPNIGN